MKKTLIGISILLSTGVFASDVHSMLNTCTQCHGIDFSKAPLGKTNHIAKGKSFEHLYETLKDFRNPEEGDSGEILMQAQIKNFSNDDLKTIAKYISSL